jgi:hypothetical protein
MTARAYYVWDSERRLVGSEKAPSPIVAAERYALRHRLPYNVALRAVAVDYVTAIGFRLEEHESND